MDIRKVNWFKSSYSNNGNSCVETSTDFLADGVMPVRDSKDTSADAPVLTFSTTAFSTFITSVKTTV